MTHLRYNGVTHGFVDQVGYALKQKTPLKKRQSLLRNDKRRLPVGGRLLVAFAS
ncbi:hypothetical protein FM123_06805 [Limosilactobacillus fermentum]|nr:hypothetical protein FM122_07025 [Limosilactobacillus fermentum]SJM58445.1 hypothetical protein FM123_06805 [Limosilactobacillus fermentum]